MAQIRGPTFSWGLLLMAQLSMGHELRTAQLIIEPCSAMNRTMHVALRPMRSDRAKI